MSDAIQIVCRPSRNRGGKARPLSVRAFATLAAALLWAAGGSVVLLPEAAGAQGLSEPSRRSGVGASRPTENRSGPAAPARDGAAAPGKGSREEIETLVRLTLHSSAARQLAAQIEPLIREGKIAEAKKILDEVVEASTFAILAADWIADPALLEFLHSHAIRGTAGAAPPTHEATDVSELRRALDEERERARSLADKLAQVQAAQEQSSAAATEVSDLQKALDEERERGVALARQHASVSEKLAGLQAAQERATAASTEVSELQKTLDEERERARSLADKLADAQAAQKRTADLALQVGELQKALAEERERARSLSDKLADVQTAQDRAAAAATEVGELQKALNEERERGKALAQQHASVSEKLASLQAAQEHAAAAAREVSELRWVLEEERERAQSLAYKLADAQAAQERTATAAAQVSELQKALAEERERAQALARQHASLSEKLARLQAAPPPEGVASGEAAVASETPRTRISSALPAPEIPTQAPAAAQPENPLVRRADALFRRGDLSGARLLLERAAQAGDIRAMFLLAETFDPVALASRGIASVRGDEAKAKELYSRARALESAQLTKPAENPNR